MIINLKKQQFTISVIYINNRYPEKIYLELKNKLNKIPNFLKNLPIVINVENLNYKNNWKKLYKIISQTKLLIIGVCCCHDNKLKKDIIHSGFPILKKFNEIPDVRNNTTPLQKKIITKKSNYIKNPQYFPKTKLIDTPIRSGQKIYAQNSDLIIINNVSSGAEIIADGNIHIYGTMKGRALAGASGNCDAQIFCTNLFPELISINGYYWIYDQIPKKFLGKSVKFSLNNNKKLTIQQI